MKKKEYIMDKIFKGSTGISQAIFTTLVIGILLENIGQLTGMNILFDIGGIAKGLMAPAIGAGTAVALNANFLMIFSSMVVASIGAGALKISSVGIFIIPGDPIGAILGAIIAIYLGKKISGKTKLDMMLIPITIISIGGISGYYIAKVSVSIISNIQFLITNFTQSNLLVSTIIISIIWGCLIVSPASSVALAIALSLNEQASGAALIGCTAQFIGFSIMSYKSNEIGTIAALFICTPKLQLPNITKKLILMIPTLIASAIAAPISVIFLNIRTEAAIAGMGLSSFVAPINILSTQGSMQLLMFIIGGIIIPGIITYIIYKVMKLKGFITDSDLKLSN